ncbi:MAG: hypothetical protein AB1599_01250 [Planctomycetota bacterium]
MPDFTELLELVDECLEKKHQPDAELVRKHNADPLNKGYQIKVGEKVERTDVVHDILVHLAEEMMAMHKTKQEEIKGFLKYLERRIGKDADDLKGKTKIKEYYDTSFNDLIKVLGNNNIKLKRADEEQIEIEFNKSVNKLKPLMEQISATDNLIDQIVYKLYGLTQEEIKIIKGS